MNVKYVPSGDGNHSVICDPLDNALHLAAWNVWVELECRYPDQYVRGSHIKTLKDNLKAALAKEGVTAETVERWGFEE